MGLLGAIFGKQRVQFVQNDHTVIQFDASIKELHSRESPPTEFPVEDGGTISDYVILKPFSLELTGIISDSPLATRGLSDALGGFNPAGIITQVATTVATSLKPAAGVVAGLAGTSLFSVIAQSKNPSVAAYGQLLDLQASAQPFTVLTSLRTYKDMWIKSLSVPRDAETGQILLFTVSLTQLLLVTPQSVNIGVFANSSIAANIADLGQQETGNPFAEGAKAGAGSTTKVLNSFGAIAK